MTTYVCTQHRDGVPYSVHIHASDIHEARTIAERASPPMTVEGELVAEFPEAEGE